MLCQAYTWRLAVDCLQIATSSAQAPREHSNGYPLHMNSVTQSVNTLESDPDRLARQVGAQAIDHLYRNLWRVAGTVLVPLVMTWIMWDQVERATLVAWCVAMLFISAASQILATAYSRRPRSVEETLRWGRFFSIAMFANGLTWGVASMLFFVPGSTALQVVLLVSIIGLCAGSISLLSYWLESYYAFIVPPLLLSALRLALEGGVEYWSLAALVLVSLAILLLVGHSVSQSVLSAIRLGFENLDLVKQLHTEKEIAENATRDKTLFLASASHDLRQPLHAMSLFADALEGRLQNPDDRLVLARLQDSLTAMRKLFNALLDISRLDAGIVEPQIKNFQLAPLLERLHVDYARQSRDKQLEWSCPPTEVIVRSDPVLLENLLRNLIGNAIRYTPQGYIAIACTEVDGWVRIAIEDSGVGIPADKQTEIFREYRQLSNPAGDGAKGLGLGLAIVERLARLLDHRIELRSAPDKGSCFTVVLPMGSASALSIEEDGESNKESALGSDLAGMTVLVIDDQAPVLEGMKALLGRWGCETILAGSEEAALTAVQQAPRLPALIIADYRLREDRTGSQAIDRVRREFGESIPALIITGDTAPERLREAQASGHMLMSKPVPPARLRAFLRTVRRNGN